MSEVDGRFVKQGLWTNLEQGEIMGKTITTDTRTGTIIIALMAILSTVGTSHLWNLIIFAFHQAQATGGIADGYFRQQQAILRTLPPPSSLMADSVKLWWSWKKRNDGVLLRSLIQLLLATLCSVGFVATSIFSSFVVNTSDLEVLVNSPSCGLINTTLPVNMFRIQLAAVASLSTPYAQECYHNSTILPARCKAFVRPSIPFTTEKVPCPFASEFCTGADVDSSSAVALDSGLVDLNDGFGLNLPEKDRVYYRRRTTCTVLPLSGHATVIDASELPWSVYNRLALPGEQALVLHYGDRPNLGDWKNATFVYSLMSTNMSRTLSVSGYTYSATENREGLGNYLEPLQGLRKDHAETALLSLVNTVEYIKPVHDPWLLSVKEKTILDKITGKNLTLHVSDSPAGRAMACTIQHQFCINTASGRDCSEPDSLPSSVTSKSWPRASSVQLSAIRLLVEANYGIGMGQNTKVLASNAIQAGGLIAMQIRADQWIAEARAMEAFVWASSQVYVTDYAIGPGVRSPELVDYVVQPTTPGDRQLCGSQKMRKAAGFVNIHVFGMALVIAASLFFAILDIAMLKFLIFLSGFRKALNPRLDRWIQDGVLQLQRRAYEAEGQGTWSHLHNDVPLTEPKESLEELSLQNLTRRSTDMTLVPTYTLPQSPRTFSDSPTSVVKKDLLWQKRSV